MSSLRLRLPESLHQKLRELAERDDISINQFIATAVAEKAAALLTVDYLEARGQRANAKLVDRVLSRVPDVPPMAGDELPTREPQSSRKKERIGGAESSEQSVKLAEREIALWKRLGNDGMQLWPGRNRLSGTSVRSLLSHLYSKVLRRDCSCIVAAHWTADGRSVLESTT